MLTPLHTCLRAFVFTYVYDFTRVYLCLPMFACVYLYLHLFLSIFPPIYYCFTYVHSFSPMFATD